MTQHSFSCSSSHPSLPPSRDCLPCSHTLAPLGPCRVLFSPRYWLCVAGGVDTTGGWGVGAGSTSCPRCSLATDLKTSSRLGLSAVSAAAARALEASGLEVFPGSGWQLQRDCWALTVQSALQRPPVWAAQGLFLCEHCSPRQGSPLSLSPARRHPAVCAWFMTAGEGTQMWP